MFPTSNRYLWVSAPSISFKFTHNVSSLVILHLAWSLNYENYAPALERLFLGEEWRQHISLHGSLLIAQAGWAKQIVTDSICL